MDRSGVDGLGFGDIRTILQERAIEWDSRARCWCCGDGGIDGGLSIDEVRVLSTRGAG